MHEPSDPGRDLLAVRDLRVVFPGSPAAAVDGVTVDVRRGETLGLVGESGSGKTTLALSVLGLTPAPGRVVSGEILFKGRDLLTQPPERLRRLRGGEIGMIHQEPGSAVDPLMRISSQMSEAVLAHMQIPRREARRRCLELLRETGISEPERCWNSFPHELSGGMLQRVLISVALLCEPSLLIGDEPTSSLDVTVQAQILELLRDVARRRSLSMLLISHDLGVVAQLADRVAVMYAGQIVEIGDIDRIFNDPSHPYTRRLLAAAPGSASARRWSPYSGAARNVDPGASPGRGCRYQAHCPEAIARCETQDPELESLGGGRWVRCHLRTEPTRRPPESVEGRRQ